MHIYRMLTSFYPTQLEGELYNGRVAMLAAAGILAVELLGRGPWYNAVNTVSACGLALDPVSMSNSCSWYQTSQFAG